MNKNMACFCFPKFFKAIGHPVRQKILEELQQSGELNVAELVKRLKLSQSTVSHHLALLKDAGAVRVKTKGVNSIYSICDDKACECCDSLYKFFRK